MQQNRINKAHVAHLLDEGFSPADIELLADSGWYSVDKDGAEELLGFEAKCGGLAMPHGDGFVQVRLDKPYFKNGRKVKYCSPRGSSPTFWKPPFAPQPKLVTEGAKDAAAISLVGGVPCGSITGVGFWNRVNFKGIDGVIYDSDAAVNPLVFKPLIECGRKKKVKIGFFPKIEGHGTAGACEYFKSGKTMEDFQLLVTQLQSADGVLLALPEQWKGWGIPPERLQDCIKAGLKLCVSESNARTFAGKVKEHFPKLTDIRSIMKDYKEICSKQKTHDDKPVLSPPPKDEVGLLMRFLADVKKPRFNELTKQVEINGEVVAEPEKYYVSLAVEYGTTYKSNHVWDALYMAAKQRSYNPVKDYLLQCAENAEPLTDEEFDNLATKILRVHKDDSTSNLFLKRFLIGAVARVFKPGCKVDQCLILQGGQGIRKSTFFNVLGGEFFSDSLGDLSSIKDDLMVVHSGWIHEWGEVERITDKRSAGALKHFITKQKDVFRPPYARLTQSNDRAFVIAGTCNTTDFLRDETGNRRYCIIRVTKQIPTGEIRGLRDRIWATAYKQFAEGKPWHYTFKETKLIEDRANAFQIQDPMLDALTNFLADRQRTTCEEVMAQVLDIPKKDFPRHAIRFSKLMTACGWRKGARAKTKHGFIRPWYPNAIADADFETPDPGSKQQESSQGSRVDPGFEQTPEPPQPPPNKASKDKIQDNQDLTSNSNKSSSNKEEGDSSYMYIAKGKEASFTPEPDPDHQNPGTVTDRQVAGVTPTPATPRQDSVEGQKKRYKAYQNGNWVAGVEVIQIRGKSTLSHRTKKTCFDSALCKMDGCEQTTWIATDDLEEMEQC